MPACSAGILLYRRRGGMTEVLLAHPGGPYWRRRDAGAWTLPKGELAAGEEAESAARREFREELGADLAQPLQPLGEIVQKAGKRVIAFAAEGDFDPARLASNPFEIEWPPHSGRRQAFPEVDRVAWFDLPAARGKLLPAQVPLLDRLIALIGSAA